MSNYLKRFKNVGTVLSLVGLVGILLNQCGVKVDTEWLNAITQTVCSILVILGVCNNPNTKGVDLPVKEIKYK